MLPTGARTQLMDLRNDLNFAFEPSGALLGEMILRAPSSFFFLISAKLMELSAWNFQYLLEHQFYIRCLNETFVPIVGWLKTTSEWRHVRAIFMQNKGLQESLSWTQFWSYNQFVCTEWRRIYDTTELLSRIYKMLKKTLRHILQQQLLKY